MATSKKSSGSTKKSSSSSTKNGKTIGSTRTAPNKTAEYKAKYANKNVTGGKKSGEKIVAPSIANPKEAQIKMIQNAIAKSGSTPAREAALARLQGKTTETTVTNQTASPEGIQSAIDYINSTDLSSADKALYIDAVKNWDPAKELNSENIIETFNKIKKDTIDPRYQGLINIAIASVKNAATAAAKQRAIELETESANLLGDTKSAQDSLEASGLTFSGKGVEYLGSKGAAVIPFGGEDVEGLIPQKHRLISTSSDARYKQSIKDLGLSAEEQLGSAKTKGLISGYTPVGSVTGSLTESKQSAEASALGTLLDQGIANSQQNNTL